ncbi:PAS domain S-box protein [Halarcobacter sp.]|uniref:PAS domain S-box protein n=1 Tax=Halarcobacter sp. TaxID=2321133 RepID=UPI0029F4935C|nr:PAS domain S-box protein [Halarcobacter sp.]
MKKFSIGFIIKIATIVGIIEFISFSIMGYVYSEIYTSTIKANIKDRIHLINKMIAEEEIPISSISRKDYISRLIGQEYKKGFIVGSNELIIVSSDTTYLGRKIQEVPDFDKTWLFKKNEEKFIYKKATLISIGNLKNSTSNNSLYRIVLSIDTKKLDRIEQKIISYSILGSLLLAFLTSFSIILFTQKLVANRIQNSLKTLQEAEKGNLDTQIIISDNDEIGQMQSGINSMIKKVGSLLLEYKNSIKEVKKANIKFSSLYNYSLDAIILVDRKNKKIEDVNPKACNLYGYEKEKFLTLHIDDLDFFSNEKSFLEIEKHILENGWDTFETRHKLKDGTIIDVKVNATAINLFERDYLYLTIRNITNEKELENQIIKQRDFVSTIIDNSNAITAVINKEGVMFRVNKYTEEFTKYSSDEIASEPYFWSRFLPEDKRGKVVEIIEKAKKGELIKSFKNSWLSKDGEEKIFQWSNMLVNKPDGTMDYLATIGVDVTQKEQIQKQIIMQKIEFETIFNYAQDGIAIVDLESNFLKFNNAFMKLTGYSNNELEKKSCIQLASSEEKDKVKEIFLSLYEKKYLENIEITFLIKDDKRVDINMSLSVLPDNNRVLILAKDITSLKIIEEQSKLVSMGEMIGNIAHQWRQPLSIITTSASGMKLQSMLDTLDKEELDHANDVIIKQAKYLSDTIENFRDFIKGESIFKEIFIKDLIEQTLSLVEASLKNNYIKTVLDIDESIKIYGNINELCQALINIINNSKDAIKEKIHTEENRFLFISVKKIDEKFAKLEIKDNAGGIEDNIINRIFEPYFTTKHQSIGTGLGLSMADKIIRKRHGFDIDVYNKEFKYENQKFKGACFSITLSI